MTNEVVVVEKYTHKKKVFLKDFWFWLCGTSIQSDLKVATQSKLQLQWILIWVARLLKIWSVIDLEPHIKVAKI